MIFYSGKIGLQKVYKCNRLILLFLFSCQVVFGFETAIYTINVSSFPTGYTNLLNNGTKYNSQPIQNTNLFRADFIGCSTNYALLYVTPKNNFEVRALNSLENLGYIKKIKEGAPGALQDISPLPSDFYRIYDIWRSSNS